MSGQLVFDYYCQYYYAVAVDEEEEEEEWCEEEEEEDEKEEVDSGTSLVTFDQFNSSFCHSLIS